MVMSIGLLEWMTKTTLKVMFYMWYVWGVWLSWFIIEDENGNNPFAIKYVTSKDLNTQAKEKVKK